jgi:phage terminase large subunit-like protein
MGEEACDGAVSMAGGVPELDDVSRVNGDKRVRLAIGERRYRVTTATRRGGRGLSSDLVLLDEFREHAEGQAWSAATKRRWRGRRRRCRGSPTPGTPVGGLASLREKALQSAADRTSTIGIFEWSAPDGCASNDQAAWAAANPALGHRMPAQAVLSALETDPEDVFAPRCVCQ